MAESLKEVCGAGGKTEVCRQGKAGTGTGGQSVDGRDNRFVQTPKEADQGVVVFLKHFAGIA